ncbi:MAG: sugar transferase [Bacteroidia bacterium]|nr:sugar transferase [Bacteroidia bacterium]
MLAKRIFDVSFSLLGLLIVLPFFILISLLIITESRGGIFYKQIRVGKGGKDFLLYKFRTMRPDSDKLGLLTVGGRDPRVTRIGYYLRKYKLDELPQLINVLKGNMSFVGPRPEVRKYVMLYNDEQLNVLKVKPGITDYASILYSSESELLAASSNPEELYIKEIMPHKLKINLQYIQKPTVTTDIKLILMTLMKIIKG